MRLAVAALTLAALALTASATTAPAIPQCQEDAVLIGIGDFENGRWPAYECGPSVDDYQPEETER